MTEQIDPDEFVNRLAVDVNEKLNAGATVVMSLLMDEDGIPTLVVGSTGVQGAVNLLAASLPHIADALRDAADGGVSCRKGLFLGPDNEN